MVRTTTRRRVLELTVIASALATTGFLQEDDDEIEEGEPEEDGVLVIWDAGGTGGTYFPLSGELKTIVEANTPHGLQVQSTGASVENVGALAREESDFGLIQNDIASFAFEGTGIEEFEGAPIENIRGVATLFPETIHVLVDAGADVESLGDLEGATVNTGDLGSGTQVNALQILEAAGVGEFEEQNTDFSTAADQLRDGDIDAAFIVGGWPVGAVEELATTADIDILEISGELQDAVLDAAPFFATDEIPGGTYDGVEDDVETVSVQAMIATHEAVDADLVEEITAAIFENADEISLKGEFIDIESSQDGMPIPLHPGAEAYFSEVLDLDEDEEADADDETDEDDEDDETDEDDEDDEDDE